MIVVLSGPAGVGKRQVKVAFKQRNPRFQETISSTTRTQRHDETDGEDYFFMSRRLFEALIDKDRFIEWNHHPNGSLYGTPKSEVEWRLKAKLDILFEIEINGATKVKKVLPQAITIFLLPDTWSNLEKRLRGRGTESEEEAQGRLALAKEEIARAHEFDYRIVNFEGRHMEAVQQIETLLRQIESGETVDRRMYDESDRVRELLQPVAV